MANLIFGMILHDYFYFFFEAHEHATHDYMLESPTLSLHTSKTKSKRASMTFRGSICKIFKLMFFFNNWYNHHEL